MKIQGLRDLHLEFGDLYLDFKEVGLVIFAGNINIGEKGFYWIKEKIIDIPIIYVLGNHEYYRHSYPKLLHKLPQLSAGTNIHILENSSIALDGKLLK